jgi:hypothetical protein
MVNTLTISKSKQRELHRIAVYTLGIAKGLTIRLEFSAKYMFLLD